MYQIYECLKFLTKYPFGEPFKTREAALTWLDEQVKLVHSELDEEFDAADAFSTDGRLWVVEKPRNL